MTRPAAIATAFVMFGLVHLSTRLAAEQPTVAGPEWSTLFDGSDLSMFDTIGDANWRLGEGVVQADQGNGFLVSKAAYGDFELRVEFWVDAPGNSGVFVRCEDPAQISSRNSYEVNINDTRPDPTYGTGAIAQVAPPLVMLKAGGKWNTFEIRARGAHLEVVLNGTKTVDINDTSHSKGRIALQYAAGTVKFRRVQIRPL